MTSGHVDLKGMSWGNKEHEKLHCAVLPGTLIHITQTGSRVPARRRDEHKIQVLCSGRELRAPCHRRACIISMSLCTYLFISIARAWSAQSHCV